MSRALAIAWRVGLRTGALICALALAAPASAKAPRQFVGMNVDGPALESAGGVPAQLSRVARAGARSVRWTVYWPALQPYRSWSDVPVGRRGEFVDAGGIPTDFRATDRFVAAASRLRLKPLPVVLGAAPWAAENPFVAFSPPMDADAFGRFAGALAARYGAGGSFWRAHPRLGGRPVQTWQIWNEPAGFEGFRSPSTSWDSGRDALRGYVALLEAARRQLRAADPHAQVMLSGLFGRPWVALDELYSAGAGQLFDAVAINPFTLQPSDVVRILDYVREVMVRNGDREKPLAVTELSWPSAVGYVRSPFEFAVTRKGQASALTRAFGLLARERRRLRLRTVYWYTWMTRDASSTTTFDHAGLLIRRPDGRVTRKPAYYAFRRMARRMNAAR